MKRLIKRIPFNEILIICLFLFTLNNFTGKSDKIIVADGIGYYEYLPSIFIHHDFNRLNKNINLDRVEPDFNYTNYQGKKINKYPCGTAILESPFFLYTLIKNHDSISNGYEEPFQKTIFISTTFYLFLGLFFLKKLLRLYNIRNSVIFTIQLFLTLGSNIYFYTYYNGSFSHIYSFFLITLFIFLVKKLSLDFSNKLFYIAITCLGMIFLVRQINILVILIIPFIYGNWNNLKNTFYNILSEKKKLVLGCLIFLSIAFIQSITWYFQVGSFIVYSYQGEGFNFLKPELFNILFSYKKGLFVYTPLIFVSIIFSFLFILKKRYFEFISFFLFFSILTFILSSWWSWYYGCSFGLRAYIDFYSILIIPLAIYLNELNAKIKLIISFFLIPVIPINLIQSYQYKEFIIHWIDMTKERYWTTFLHTENQYKGLLWNNFPSEYEMTSFNKQNFILGQNNTDFEYLFSEEFKKSKYPILKIQLDGFFNSRSNSKIKLSFTDQEKNIIHYDERYTLTYSNEKINRKGKGYFYYTLESKMIEKTDRLHIKIENPDNEFNILTLYEKSKR